MSETASSVARRPTTVLVIDDDTELTQLLSRLMAGEGLRLLAAPTAQAGLQRLEQAAPSIVLLDLMLPDANGIELFGRIRQRCPDLPVIMLTAKGDPVDRVVGLELGADDYVAKPFDPRELIARVRSVLRRSRPAGAAVDTQLVLGAVTLDTAARVLAVGARQVPLTSLEFRLLLKLAQHPGEPQSREALTRAAQVGNYRPLERAVDVQIARLRRKLRQVNPQAQWIVTARGEGYLWSPPAQP